MKRIFEVGQRVKVVGHWEFPDGTVGTVVMPHPFQVEMAGPGEWQGHRRTVAGRKGPIVFYCIRFERATDDGSADGPYGGGEIEEENLIPLAPDA